MGIKVPPRCFLQLFMDVHHLKIKGPACMVSRFPNRCAAMFKTERPINLAVVWLLSAIVLTATVCLGPAVPALAATSSDLAGTTTMAISKTPGLVMESDKLLLIPQELFSGSAATEFTVTRLPSPTRLIVEFPNASLNPIHRNRRYEINRYGLQYMMVTEEKGQLYSSVRLTLFASSFERLDQMKVVRDGGLIAVVPPTGFAPPPPAPVATRTATPKPTVSAAPVKPAARPSAPVATVASVTAPVAKAKPSAPDALSASALPASGAVMAAPTGGSVNTPPPDVPIARIVGTTQIEDIRIGRDGLLLLGPEVGPRLALTNRLVLSNPTRVVFDFANSQLANKRLAQTLSAGQNGLPSGGSWRSLRIGQFDERTVRVVVETAQPQAFKLVRRGDPAIGQFIAIESDNGLYANVNTQAQPTQLRNVMLSRQTANGQAQLKVEGRDPLAFQIHNDGGQVTVDLLNVALNGPGMAFNVADFDYISGLSQRSLFPKTSGSSLVLALRGQSGRITHELLDGGRTLILTFDLPKSGPVQPVIAKQPATPTTTPAIPKVPPSGTLARAPFRARVVVDAGHGGKDTGAMRSGVLEKDLNLSMALNLKTALESRGLTVLMTRSSDTFVPLPDISGFANRNGPDLFISVHHNASVNTSIAGLETYYYHGNSIPLANKIHAQMVRMIGCNNRGVRSARFYVINHTKAPAVLLEMGYVSNPSELQAVQSSARQKVAAEAIANGVVDYLNARVTALATPPAITPAAPTGGSLVPSAAAATAPVAAAPVAGMGGLDDLNP